MTSHVLTHPKTHISSLSVFQVVLGACFMAVLSSVSIPLGFTPVPITLQTLALFLLAGALGPRKGAASVALYVGGRVCVASSLLLGYYVGFILATYLIGLLFERGWKENFSKSVLALFIGEAVILLLGMYGLAPFVGGIKNAYFLGVVPFLIGDAIKVILAAALLPLYERSRLLR